MRPWVIRSAQALIALILLALVVIQGFFGPLIAHEAICCEAAGEPHIEALAVGGLIWLIVEAACVQVFLVVVWMLLSMIRRERIFAARALRLVVVMIWCAVVFAALTIPFGVVFLALQILPAVVAFALLGGLIGGLAVALVLVALRELLATATRLNDELSEVV